MLTRCLPVLFTVIALATACGPTVKSQYETTLATMRPDLGETASRWRGDADLWLSAKATESMIRTEFGVTGALPVKPIRFPGGEILPRLTVSKLRVLDGDACRDCIRISLNLSGQVKWTLGRRQGVVPVSARPTLDLTVEAQRRGETWQVLATPRNLDLGSVEAGDLGGGLRRALVGVLEQSLERVDPFVIARFQGQALPLRAARARVQAGGFAIELLTASPTSAALPPGRAATDSTDWQFRLHQESLTGLVRAGVLQKGLIGGKVALDPRSIRLRDETFELLLRIWRPKPLFCGWWRDYRIAGDLRIDRGGLQLARPEVSPAGQSFGAPLVDPLVALAEAKLLAMIEEAAAATVPGRQTLPTRRATYRSEVVTVRGSETHLTLGGSLKISPSTAPGSRKLGGGGRR